MKVRIPRVLPPVFVNGFLLLHAVADTAAHGTRCLLALLNENNGCHRTSTSALYHRIGVGIQLVDHTGGTWHGELTIIICSQKLFQFLDRLQTENSFDAFDTVKDGVFGEVQDLRYFVIGDIPDQMLQD